MRTASARSKVPSDLKPGKQQALLRQDWQPPEMCHDINSVGLAYLGSMAACR